MRDRIADGDGHAQTGKRALRLVGNQQELIAPVLKVTLKTAVPLVNVASLGSVAVLSLLEKCTVPL